MKIINKALFQTSILYGTETWAVSIQADKLMMSEIDFWKCKAQKSRHERIQVSKIKELMQVDNILVTIE